VRSFLERSKRQVESYFRDKMGMPVGGEDGQQQIPAPADEDIELIYIQHNEEDQTTVAAVQDPNGNVHTVTTPLKDVVDDDDHQDSADVEMFDRLEDFLNPDNAAIRKLIEHRVLKKPNVLTELLTAKFSDLVKLFQKLMRSKTTTMEAAYLHLLQIAEDEGAEGITQRANNNYDQLVEAVTSDDGSNIEYKLGFDPSYEVPSLKIRGLNNVLSDEEIEGILEKYLSNIGLSSDEDVADTRRQKVKAAAIMDLLSDEVEEKLSQLEIENNEQPPPPPTKDEL
jgi:hypothetical protein